MVELTQDLTIARVGLEGQGIGYDDARNIFFVPGALPGDRVRVTFSEGAPRYRDARLVEVIESSPDRVDPECAAFPECGGCDWLNWRYDAQVAAKQAMLDHVLGRAGWVPEKRMDFRVAPEIYGYRNRIQVRHEGNRVGFYRRKSHDLVDVGVCRVAHPALNAVLGVMRDEPVAERHKTELSVDEQGTVHRVEDSPHASRGFEQINPAQNEVLRTMVADRVRAVGAKRVLELFCGNANLTTAYLDSVEECIGVDSGEAVVAAARLKRDAMGETATRKLALVCEPADRTLRRKLPPEFRAAYDTLILDPPRSGLSTGLESFIHPDLRNIIYVSCSPASFVRDVQCLKGAFALNDVEGIDMFPHTRHVEFVARFSRC